MATNQITIVDQLNQRMMALACDIERVRLDRNYFREIGHYMMEAEAQKKMDSLKKEREAVVDKTALQAYATATPKHVEYGLAPAWSQSYIGKDAVYAIHDEIMVQAVQAEDATKKDPKPEPKPEPTEEPKRVPGWPFVSKEQVEIALQISQNEQDRREKEMDDFEAKMQQYLTARGLVVVPQVDVEDGKVKTGETLSQEPSNSTPRGLLVLAATPGHRMGTAAWQEN